MNLSYKILSVAGIDIELHLLFIIFILAFAAFNPLYALLLVLVFFFVTLHELCHSFVALRHHIRVRKIILLPIGGMAMIDATDVKPWTEFKMALAGPAFNLIVAGACLLIASAFQLPLWSWLESFLKDETLALSIPQLLLFYSFYANLILGLFNLLLPAFPLDGGRILRAALALKLDYVQATGIARVISLGIAGVLFVLGLMGGGIWIMIIAFFIAFGATAEFETMMMHRALAKVSPRSLVTKDFFTVKPTTTLSAVAGQMLKHKKMNALVSSKPARVIDLLMISQVPRPKWGQVKAGALARPAPLIRPGTPLEKVLQTMTQSNVSMLPVAGNGRAKISGVIYRADIEKIAKMFEIIRKGK